MKKLLCLAAAAVLLALLSGCSSEVPRYQNEKGTPKDSVVIYGFFKFNDKVVLSQVNPKFSADNIDMEEDFIITKPLKPGSVYRWEYAGGHYFYTTSCCLTGYSQPLKVWTGYFPMNNEFLDINVPSTPGIYFIGLGSGEETFNEGSFVLYDFLDEEKIRLRATYYLLKRCLKYYKGTQWEPLFQEKMNEIVDEVYFFLKK